MKKVILLLATIFSISCSNKEEKKVNTINNPVSEISTLEDDKDRLSSLLNALEDKSLFFDVSSSKPKSIKGKKGTIIHLVPKDLELENGNKLGTNLKIELKELVNQNDFFRNNSQTTSDGKLLVSGGSYYIDITSDGNKVKLKKGKTLAVEFPKFTNKKMELFYGERDSLNQMNWKTTNISFANPIPKQDGNPIDIAPDTERISSDFDDLLAYTENGKDEIPKKNVKKIIATDSKIYEAIELSKLGWINCDAFYNKLTESFAISYNNTNELEFVKSFVIFKDINSVMNLFSLAKKTGLSNQINLPANQKIKIISFSFKNEKFYFGEKEVTLTKDKQIEINLKEVAEKELNNLISNIKA